LGPPGAARVIGADDPVERRAGRQIRAQGGDRAVVRSTPQQVSRGFGLQWVSMRRLGPVPWSQRVWALPFLPALCWPAEKHGRRRHTTRVDWGRPMIKPVRRGLPNRQLVLVVDGGVAAVARALACVQHRVAMVSRGRWDAALDHPPGPQPQGKRAPTPLRGTRQRRLPGGAARSDTPWETVAVDGDGG
jgi:hypothetical protein